MTRDFKNRKGREKHVRDDDGVLLFKVKCHFSSRIVHSRVYNVMMLRPMK